MGATAIEYALIAAGISIVIVAVVNGIGTNLNTIFGSVSSPAQLSLLWAGYEKALASGGATTIVAAITAGGIPAAQATKNGSCML